MKTINLTLPVYNEERVLRQNVGTILKALSGLPLEIVIASNGSNDRTEAIARELSREHPFIQVLTLTEPGRGRALKKAWSESRADILSYMDIDLATDLRAYHALIQPLLDGRFDLATGSRRLSGSITERRFTRWLFSSIYHQIVKSVFATELSDVQCGFKAVTRRAANRILPLIEQPGWLMDLELLLRGERFGYRVLEVPVIWKESNDSRVRVLRESIRSVIRLSRLRRSLKAPSRIKSAEFIDEHSLVERVSSS